MKKSKNNNIILGFSFWFQLMQRKDHLNNEFWPKKFFVPPPLETCQFLQIFVYERFFILQNLKNGSAKYFKKCIKSKDFPDIKTRYKSLIQTYLTGVSLEIM